ncbi:KELT protein [Plasmodium ovale wallikeri]|uniref:KELT protein n=1 Tax=Plasmodium ovale wallikeri TaxID=864142 RepID=A0A1A8ZJ12_PLAOA|nr:KELT protein [Plasmodium ovale wallikeri]SBT44349.1 KELT protein [Plasmodium ovale wallikeri]
MTHFNMLIILILLCTPICWKIKKCVRKVKYAEREPALELKESDTEEEFDEESFTTPMSLLSMSYTGIEEDENIEQLGALGEIGEMEELGALEEIGEMEELGASGGIAKIEKLEDSWSIEYDEEYGRTRRGSRKIMESKELEEYLDMYEDFPGRCEIKRKLNKSKPEHGSLFTEYAISYESSLDIDEDVLEVFVDSINRSNALLPTISVSLIQKCLEAGINGEERISKLHNEYPLNRCKRIDFRNLRSPFGTELKCLKDLDEEQLNDILFIDDFLIYNLCDFLKETKVGKFFLSEVCSFYKVGSIKFIPCNLELLEYLSVLFPPFNIDDFLYKNMGTYLGRCHNYFWDFWHRKIPVIQMNTEKDKNLLEEFKNNINYRDLTSEEMQELRHIFNNGKRNISGMRKLLKIFEKRIQKINEDLRTLLLFFPVNTKYLNRDELIVTCIHYILSFCVQLIKPLYDKAQCNEYIEYDTFSNASRSLNELLNHLEMLEFNSELYNIFCVIYPEFDKYYPRLNSFEEIIDVYNYLVVKLQFIVVIFDISKFLLKLYSSLDVIKYYRNHTLISYKNILSDTEALLRDSQRMIKELT